MRNVSRFCWYFRFLEDKFCINHSAGYPAKKIGRISGGRIFDQFSIRCKPSSYTVNLIFLGGVHSSGSIKAVIWIWIQRYEIKGKAEISQESVWVFFRRKWYFSIKDEMMFEINLVIYWPGSGSIPSMRIHTSLYPTTQLAYLEHEQEYIYRHHRNKAEQERMNQNSDTTFLYSNVFNWCNILKNVIITACPGSLVNFFRYW